MKKLICTFYYYVFEKNEIQITTTKITENDLRIEAINTLLNYLHMESLTLKKISMVDWH